MNTRTETGAAAEENDRVYDNSVETGIVQGAEFDQDDETNLGGGQQTNAGGLTREEGGIHMSILSDNPTGNNSMGTNTIGGGLGVGSNNSNSTLP